MPSPPLSLTEQLLLRLTAAIVLGRWDEVQAVRASAPTGEPDRAWREAVLQVHLFSGIPRQLEAYEALERAGGLGAVGPEEALAEPDLPERGAGLFDRIYGAHAEAVRARIAAHHPDFARWVGGHAYGRVLTRPGLSARVRELLAVGALAALGQERQLASHARGAVACGATAEEVREAVEAVSPLLTEERLVKARQVVAHFARAPRS
jgi:4-carboxymuconolactone decarboxylase